VKLTATDWIWHDGKFIRWADATTHVLAHSMQYGSAVFEGVRCYNTPDGPAIFRLEDHLRRLLNSCRIYRMDPAFSLQELIAGCCALVEKNGLDACYLRPMVIRGYGAASMVPFDSPIEVYLPCWPWGAYLGDGALETGVDACVSSWNRVEANTLPAMAKIAGNYLSGQLIKMEALANGFQEGIALGTDGKISEGSGQNVFLVRNGRLHTAPVSSSILPGITRDCVLTLAGDLGLEVREEQLPRESLYVADEVFFAGTASEITPVRSIDKMVIGQGKPGPVTRLMQQTFLDVANGRAPDRHGWLTHTRTARPAAASTG
jgi:branched-chain amino acid aminotransferase